MFQLNKFLYYHTHILEKLGFSSAVSKAPGSAAPQPQQLSWSWSCPRCGARLGFGLGEAKQSRVSPSSGRTRESQTRNTSDCNYSTANTPSSLLEKVM